MPSESGFVDNTGTEGLAHWQMLLAIKTFAEANGWTTLRYLNPSDGSNRELILQGVGLSGDQAIFIGFRTYHSVSADYYNLSVAGFTGYVAGNAFTAQPGYFESGVPGHNQRIDYWLNVNAQRIVFGLKVGTPVYEHGYAGYFYPYATPGQFPYPLAVGGMLAGVPATRYSDTNHSMPYKGSRANMAMRFLDGTWKQISCRPWTGYPNGGINIYSGSGIGMSYMRDTGGDYPLPAVELMDASNVYGYLDGVHSITGFNNVVENTVTVGGLSHIVLQDVSRTGFIDYCALEMP